ncbi:MAG: asparagine synthase-related protein [Hyphomonadaceae bacterium]
MHYENWLIGIERSAESKGAPDAYLQRLIATRPGSVFRQFDLWNGRDLGIVHAKKACTIENPRFWVWALGVHRPAGSLLRAIEAAGGGEELRRVCSAPDAAGSAFLILDKEAGRLVAVTDPLNAAKLFRGRIGTAHVIASKLSLLPRGELAPDPGAIASYVINGNCINNRTAFRDFRCLERASIHEFAAEGETRTSYWHYHPGTAPRKSRSIREGTEALWELVVQSVDRATRGKQVLLALSGGYDSGVLLGILGAQLRHPAITCFSYCYGPPKPGSDAEVAARQAALYGYPHVVVDSYSGDLPAMLDGNATIGEGLRSPSYEIEAFPDLARRVGPGDDRIMLFGDECFGWGSYRLRDANDLLGAINMKSPSLLDIFKPFAGDEAVETMRAALEADYDALRRRGPDFDNPDDRKDFLYLDQRIQFSLLPLRGFVAGNWFPVATPFLGREILDFMAAVPTELRVDKRLFKIMGRKFLPDLFRMPRATRGQLHPDFGQEIAASRDALERAIAADRWGIPGLFDGEVLASIVRDFDLRMRQTERRSGGGIRHELKKTAKRLFAASRFIEDRQRFVRRLTYNDFDRSPGREFLIMNLLCMADFLGGTASSRAFRGAA